MRLPETTIEVTEADDGDLFLRVLDEALDALTTADIPFLLIGGIGSAVYGRDQGTRDIDVFVRPETARRVLEVLGARGFETKEVAERWLSKAMKHGVLVDVIFRSTRDICSATTCSIVRASCRSAAVRYRSRRRRTSSS
jgi:acetolactate synthase regulatory subunit